MDITVSAWGQGREYHAGIKIAGAQLNYPSK